MCVCLCLFLLFFFSSRSRHTRCALVTGVQTCALPIYQVGEREVRNDLPVRLQTLEPVDVVAVEVRVRGGQFVECRHPVRVVLSIPDEALDASWQASLVYWQTVSMGWTSWENVRAKGLEVPDDRPLTDLTAELTAMLGSIDPARRDDTAYLVLATWISRGVYDDLLSGLGDGMAAGLAVGLGEKDSDNVFRRSFSALVLAECLRRNTVADLLTTDKVLTWGDRLPFWFLREQALREIGSASCRERGCQSV